MTGWRRVAGTGEVAQLVLGLSLGLAPMAHPATTDAPAAGGLDPGHYLLSLDDPRHILYQTAITLGFGSDRITTVYPVSADDLAALLAEAGDGIVGMPDGDGLPVTSPDLMQGPTRSFWHLAPAELEIRANRMLDAEEGLKRYSSGDTYEEGMQLRIRDGVTWEPIPQLGLSVQGRFESGRTDTRVELTRATASLRLAGLRLTLGRQPRWWGPGVLNAVLLTNNALPTDGVELATDGTRHLPLLGPYRFSVFLNYLDDADRPTRYPLLFGTRVGWRPFQWIEFGAARTIMLGGEDRTEKIQLEDLWNIFLGRGENRAGYVGHEDTDQRVVLDGILHLDRFVKGFLGLEGARFFYRYGGDDALNGVLPTLVLHHVGATALIGHTRIDAEWTESVDEALAFRNADYPAGHTYHGAFMGGDLGYDSRSVRARVTSALGPDWGLKIDLLTDIRGYEYHEGEGVTPDRGSQLSAGVEAGIAVARRLAGGSRVVIGYRHRQTVDGYSYDQDREHPRHSVSVLFRAL